MVQVVAGFLTLIGLFRV